jgi:hypothetical protein
LRLGDVSDPNTDESRTDIDAANAVLVLTPSGVWLGLATAARYPPALLALDCAIACFRSNVSTARRV